MVHKSRVVYCHHFCRYLWNVPSISVVTPDEWAEHFGDDDGLAIVVVVAGGADLPLLRSYHGLALEAKCGRPERVLAGLLSDVSLERQTY